MPPKKGKGSKKDDEDFDALLKQLSQSTKAKGEAEKAKHKHEPKHVTQAERKAAHRKVEQEKEAAAAQQLEARARERRLQEMIREMMNGGMGSPFRAEPMTDITKSSSIAKPPATLIAGCAEMQGWRKDMEDAHIMYPNFLKTASDEWHLYSVMDGHGGSVVAKTCKSLHAAILLKCIEGCGNAPTDEAFERAFSQTDAAILKKHGEAATQCGCTCVTTLISKSEVICASVGDSRAVLARKAGTPNDVVPLSFDHKPENDAERRRIEAAEGHVANNRVNGNLAMSRAIGDFVYKKVDGKGEHEQQVINLPDVIRAPRKADDEFVVVACDGIFDVLSNDEVVEMVRKEMASVAGAAAGRLNAEQLETVAANITKECLAPAGPNGQPTRMGTDNMSIIVVQL